MKLLVRAILWLSSVLFFVGQAYSQCEDVQAQSWTCYGANGCKQNYPKNYAENFGSYNLILVPFFCCGEKYTEPMIGDVCEAAAIRLIPAGALEFASTQTLWIADCSGRFAPRYLSGAAPDKPLDLRPKIRLN